MPNTPLTNDPQWLRNAYKDLGLRETVGPVHTKRVVEMFARAGHPEVKDDETAWCSAAANAWMEEASIRGTGSLAARSWMKWGRGLGTEDIPRGAVCVFRRGSSQWQGHVAFCVEDKGNTVRALGGNQSNAVSVATFPKENLLAVRWPDTVSNSRTVQATAASGVTQLGAQGIAESLEVAKDSLEPYAGTLKLVQYLLVGISLALAAFVIYRFVTRHLRPRSEEPV